MEFSCAIYIGHPQVVTIELESNLMGWIISENSKGTSYLDVPFNG
jgi:hypothetical protein